MHIGWKERKQNMSHLTSKTKRMLNMIGAIALMIIALMFGMHLEERAQAQQAAQNAVIQRTFDFIHDAPTVVEVLKVTPSV